MTQDMQLRAYKNVWLTVDLQEPLNTDSSTNSTCGSRQ